MTSVKVEVILPSRVRKRKISKEVREYIEAVKAAEKLNELLDEVDLDEIEREAEEFRRKFRFRSFSN